MKVTVRNRNEGKKDSTGKKRAPNWEWRFYGASVDGKRQYFSHSGYATKKDAQAAGNLALAEYQGTGDVFNPSTISVSDFFNIWMKEYVSVNLKQLTMESYKFNLDKHILPEIGQYYLKDVNSITLQRLINKKFNEGYTRKRLTILLAIMSGGFTYAKDTAHFIAENPTDNLKIPGKRAIPEHPKEVKTRRPVTDEEWARIIDRFPEGTTQHIPLVIAYKCGLRLGETFALFWSDIDFEKSTITVNRQVQYSNTDKVWYLTTPKYDSVRTITVDKNTMDLLRREKEKQDSNRVFYAEYYTDPHLTLSKASSSLIDAGIIGDDGIVIDMVMRREDGSWTHPRIMRHAGRVIHGMRGTPCISKDWDYHSLRHTHATKLVEMGIPMQMIQERLGHTNVETTAVYTHTTDFMRSDLAAKLNQL